MKVLMLVFALLWCGAALQPVGASLSPHPIILYEKGDALLKTGRGSSETFVKAQEVFVKLIHKHPHSPFGYLGMSRLYRIEAWQAEGQKYDLELIRKGALPYALKALELGPSIRAVHENYDFFEQFFQQPSVSITEGIKGSSAQGPTRESRQTHK